MGERADIWGAGVCLHFALTGGMTLPGILKIEHLPPSKLGERLLSVTEKERLTWIEQPGLSWESPAVNVLWGCTHPDASERPEPSLLMAHPWLSRIDVPGQEHAKKRTGLSAQAMETCAIRVCSNPFGSNDVIDLPCKERGGTTKIDSHGNVIINPAKEVDAQQKSNKANRFWTTPNVENLDMNEEELFDTSKLDPSHYEVEASSGLTSLRSSQCNSISSSRRPSVEIRSLASPNSVASPKFCATPRSLDLSTLSPTSARRGSKGSASPPSGTRRNSRESLDTVDEVPITLAAALERLAQGAGSASMSRDTTKTKKKQSGYPAADGQDLMAMRETH
jgi:hypothetical protein